MCENKIQIFIDVCFMCFWIIDKDASPSTEVPRKGTTSSNIENVITVEVNNKNEIHRYGHTFKSPGHCFPYILNNS